MICRKQRLLYLHPSKTGGTSVEAALAVTEIGCDLPRNGEECEHLAVLTYDVKQHWPYGRLVRHFPEGRDWRSFATVRHPYDRARSEFRFQLKGHRHHFPSPAHEQACLERAVLDGSLWRAALAFHGVAQRDYVGPRTELLRFEKLGEDWPRFSDVPLPHKQLWEAEGDFDLSDSAKREIQNRFPKDFKELGYQR